MTTIAVRTEHDRKQALKMVEGSELPYTLTKIKGAPRSIEQNKLQRLWMRELEEQAICGQRNTGPIAKPISVCRYCLRKMTLSRSNTRP